MSATLVDDAALIKNFAADPESIRKPITPKVSGDIGERLIISPALVDSGIEDIATTQLVLKIRADHEVNVVVLTPARQRYRIRDDHDPLQVTTSNIGDVIRDLSTSRANTAIFANRYDGIDLPNEACRVLVLDDLPREHRLANQLEAAARWDSPFIKRQIAQKIEQGMGRGVRSRADHCVVILTGKRLVEFITDVDNQEFFTAETKKQFDVGKRASARLKSGETNPYQAILDLVSQCLQRDSVWQQYHRNQLQRVEPTQQPPSSSSALTSAELRAWQHAFKGQYQQAAQVIGELMTSNQLTDIDQGWYLQLEAEYLYHADQTAALEKQLKAHDLNRNLLRPPHGVRYRKIQAKHSSQVYAVLDWLRRSTEPNALVSRANLILDDLAFGIAHDTFEKALDELAGMIGFASQRPDHDVHRGPDVLWRMSNAHHLIFESKNEIDLNRQKIYKKEAEQLGHHITWFKQEYPGEGYTPILVHPSTVLEGDAYLEDGTLIMESENLQSIAESVKLFVVALASKPPESWAPNEISAHLQTYRLRPDDLLNRPLGKSPDRPRR